MIDKEFLQKLISKGDSPIIKDGDNNYICFDSFELNFFKNYMEAIFSYKGKNIVSKHIDFVPCAGDTLSFGDFKGIIPFTIDFSEKKNKL